MTIAEIAKLAGVSIGTVDRVLHNRGRVAPKTVETIMAIIDEYGYQPNAFARNLRLSKTYTIGVILPHLHSEYGYWRLIYNGVLKAVKELAQLAVSIELVEYDRLDPKTFLAAVTKVLDNKVDAILLAPLLPDETRLMMERHPQISYAFIDSPLPCRNQVITVAQNPFRGGFLAGKLMNLHLGSRAGTLVVINTHTAAFNAAERARGFIEYYADKPNYTVLQLDIEASRTAEEALEQAYHDHSDLSGIFVVNNAVARFAAHIALLGRRNHTIVIGYDLVEQNRAAMLEGKVDCLISQRPEFQGYTATYQLYRKGILNQKPDEDILIPIDIILAENIRDDNSYGLEWNGRDVPR
ncbi:MAG: LacI family DNA-binding transcriptional regulator [Sphaerochaeta sp.]|jgi:LacI family transcriptional regulator|nr:LacI family transcriptional regulator [Sphaerochaeta sp.]MDX9915596.1 LacI family DNA-binding transcriptional regulator [Sphaerochaeta sp.]